MVVKFFKNWRCRLHTVADWTAFYVDVCVHVCAKFIVEKRRTAHLRRQMSATPFSTAYERGQHGYEAHLIPPDPDSDILNSIVDNLLGTQQLRLSPYKRLVWDMTSTVFGPCASERVFMRDRDYSSALMQCCMTCVCSQSSKRIHKRRPHAFAFFCSFFALRASNCVQISCPLIPCTPF